MEKFEITRVYSDREEKLVDFVTEEVPLTIYVNDQEVVTILASPTDLTELAVGFVYTSGFITDFDQITKITQDTKRWTVSLQLRDGQFDSDQAFRRKNTSNIRIHRDQVYQLMAEFQNRSIGFKETGGVHSAGLADIHQILVIREDIGRHNTIDKILGYSLMNNCDLSDKMILSSGRISSEILLKIQKTQIGVIITRGAPTDQAVKHAQECDITLIGFVRGRRMNVYNGMDRIT